MTAITRSESRRQATANLTRADSDTLKTPKTLRVQTAPKVSKISRTPKTKRSSKSSMASPKRLQPSLLPAPPPTDATPLISDAVAPWVDESGHPTFSHFRAIDWNVPASVTGISPQISPTSPLGSLAIPLGSAPSTSTTEPTNPKPETEIPPRPFKKPTKAFLKSKNNPRPSPTSSTNSSPRIAALQKPNIKSVSPNTERLPCTSSSCPVHPIPHKQGTYLHGGASPKNHFTFGWSNPPPTVWSAHRKNRHDEASEAELELIADFRAHHDQRAQAGGTITTAGICQIEPVKVRECSFTF